VITITYSVAQEDCPRYGEEVEDVEAELTVSTFELFVLAGGLHNLQLAYARSTALFRVPFLLTALPLGGYNRGILMLQADVRTQVLTVK
jgi:hypothetical protein